jgi:hypothetical protein
LSFEQGRRFLPEQLGEMARVVDENIAAQQQSDTVAPKA